ncbi:MAG: acyl-CoA dehydrogenase family protein, partial [Candidatus Eremiobacteraeota bacterium]|nr:acyl-CoA dehydrogenase family protein [Candidatus Eremiobacteraeota bacterium]
MRTSTLAAVQLLTAWIAERAGEIERERRIPRDVLDALVAAGCCRMVLPAAYGGDELRLADMLAVVETLARADGAVGWTVGQIALAHLIFAFLPEDGRAEIFANGPDVIGAGAFAPKGKAMREDGGWRVTGRWPFATGCADAAWVYVQCVTVEGRKIRLAPTGMPETRVMVFPAREIEIVDTWHVVGLRGTGSHDVGVAKAHCPDRRSCALSAQPAVASTIFRIPLMDHAGLFIAAAAVGVAQAAIDDIVALAMSGKRPAFSPRRLAEDPVFQDRLGEAHMTLRASRALLYAQAENAWETAAGGAVA